MTSNSQAANDEIKSEELKKDESKINEYHDAEEISTFKRVLPQVR